MGTKKTRVRLSNEEKAVGMTVAEKKKGVTIAQKKRDNANKEETFEPVVEGEVTGEEKISFLEEPPHGEEFVYFEANEVEDVLAVMPSESEKTQEDLNESHEKNAPTGLGDVIDAVTTVTGVKALVKFFTPEGEDCGCEERRKKFNELHLRGKQPLCLELDEYTFLKEFFDSNPFEANASQAMRTRTIYARIFRMDVSQVGSCSGCMRDLINELKAIVGTYE